MYADKTKAELIELLATARVDGVDAVNKQLVDPHAGMPSLIPAVDPPENGFWILKPGAGASREKTDLQYAFFGVSQITFRTYGSFNKDSELIPSYDGNIWVSSPVSSNGGSARALTLVTQSAFVVENMYDKVDGTIFRSLADRFGDCRNGVWALCPGSDPRREQKLVCVNFRFPKGHVVVPHVPLENTRLCASNLGGCWLFVPSDLRTVPGAMGRGLWFITTSRSNHVLTNVHERAIMSHDHEGCGVWIVEPSNDHEGKTTLTQVGEDGATNSQELPVKFDTIHGICNAGALLGVYLCYNVRNAWKIGYASLGVPNVKQICTCQRNSTITSCGKGGVWIWSQTTAESKISYLDTDEKLHVSSSTFPATSRIGVVG